MDYRELLKKYMQGIGRREGTYLIWSSLLTDEEEAELEKLANELGEH